MLKNLLLWLLLIPNLVLANSYSSISYTITRLFDNTKPFIKIEAEITGNLNNKIIINLPDKWAGVNYYKQIKNIKLDPPQIKTKTLNGKQLVITTTTPTKKINFSYEIHQNNPNELNVHNTIICEDLIHSPGYGIFAIPNDLKDNDQVEFNIAWKNIPTHWRTLSDHGIGQTLRFISDSSKLLDSIYIAGNVETYKIVDSKNPVYLSLYGKFDLPNHTISKILSKIIKSQRKFFNDNDFPYYLISLIEGDEPGSIGGTKLYNSFSAFLPKGLNQKDYNILFAHEHLHNWIGGKIHKDKHEELNYWWSEGFTEYYSKVLELRSGNLSIEDFVDECNSFLKLYYLSPVINETNIKIKKDFWKNYSINKLPYYRGFVFAIYLNNLIKKNNPVNSLDNIMLDLLATAKQNEFSMNHFQNIVKKYVPQGIKNELSMFITQGKTIPLEDLLGTLPLEKILMGPFDLGFNKKIFKEHKIIKNIDEKSNAYQAGLRNGDKIIGWDFPKGSEGNEPDQIVEIKTTNKIIKFRPESKKQKLVYQFSSSLSEADKNKIREFFGAQQQLRR